MRMPMTTTILTATAVFRGFELKKEKNQSCA